MDGLLHTPVTVLTLAKLPLSELQKRVLNEADVASFGSDATSGLLTTCMVHKVRMGFYCFFFFKGLEIPFKMRDPASSFI